MSELLKLNVSEHTEKKNGLTYLSWAWAWSTVLKIDPLATWEAVEFNSVPATFLPDGSAMVKTIVTIKGHAKSCWLPVMDNRNKAIKNPDAFAINTAIVRCLTKAISMHGLGLYIYAGEDLPPLDTAALDELITELVKLHEEKNDVQACLLWYSNEMILNSNEARMYAWEQMRPYSALRSAIKANKPQQETA
jgi:hypothetical protein